jgi:hypothetical protein
LGWVGIADLLTLSTKLCEIRDFKTGISKQEHEFQLRVYALLWARDRELNPAARLADKLVLSYGERDVDVPAPTANALRSLEVELRERTAVARATLQINPPEARPSPEDCMHCTVRHLCEEFWQRCHECGESRHDQFADLQVNLTGRHGPSSWDGVVKSLSGMKPGGPILLRAADRQFDLHPGQELRLLNVRISRALEEPIEDECPPVVATMGASTEAYFVSR